MATKRKKVLKLQVSITWENSEGPIGPIDVKSAILRENDIVIEYEFEEGLYNARLISQGENRFEGDILLKDGGVQGSASCDLTSNKEGYLLSGTWIEDGYEFHWRAKLKEAARIGDDVSD